MALITSNMRKQASLVALAMAALFSHSLVIPVMSTTEYYSPKPSTTITPPAGDTPANINCNNPPHGGSGGGGGGGSDGHHEPSTPSRSPPSGGGYHYSPPPYTPTTPTPTIPTPPKTPVVAPPTTDPHTPTPSTPNPTPSTPTYTPKTPTVAPPTVPHTPTLPIPTTPPSVGTPPFPFPNTPPLGTTPPFSFDPRIPSSSGPFPCTFWRMHPTMIWGLMGWNGNTVSNTFGVGNVGGFGAGMNLLEALSNTRTDGFGELYREGTAALLNSMASNSFPFSAQQVKLSFGRAALSSNGDAAGAQAQLFKMANEGHYKPASP